MPPAPVRTEDVAAAPAAAVTSWRQWYLVFALATIAAVAAVDRIAISLLVDPIKADLKLSDTQIGLILGLSFWVFSTIGSIPAGWVVDRVNRKRLLAAGVSCWALVTTACGLAQNFVHLFLGRAGVGFSEGLLQPAAFSLIRDAVAPARLGRAFGIYSTGTFIGGGIALFAAGGILGMAERHGPWLLAGYGEIRPWQMVFFVIGIASIPFAALLLPVIEPARRQPPIEGSEDLRTYRAAFRYVAAHWRTYIPIVLFAACFVMMASSYTAWSAAIIHRTYGIPLPKVGLMLGPIFLLAPSLGTICGGTVLDIFGARGLRLAPNFAAVAITILLVGLAVAAPLAPTLFGFWCLFVPLLFVAAWVGPLNQMLIARATPPRLSGKVFALYSLVSTIISISGAPLLVGLLSDRLFDGPLALGRAVSTLSGIVLVLAMLSAIWMLVEARRAGSIGIGDPDHG